MRNVVYSTNISIDGCCDHTFAVPDEELMTFFTGLIQDADLLVYGRITYELMVPYWPDVAKSQSGTKEENEFAHALTETDKVVFSRTLQHAEGNTKIIRGNLEEEILKLKRQPGGKISIGGIDLPSQLMALDLVDEFNFVVHPIIVGKGRRLLEGIDLAEKLNLKLVDSRTFRSGCVAHHYLRQ
jgi:dihydrofolate reductase